MSLQQCPQCGKMISDLAIQCPQCGYPVLLMRTQEQKILCNYCGCANASTSKFCESCGAPLEKNTTGTQAPPQNSFTDMTSYTVTSQSFYFPGESPDTQPSLEDCPGIPKNKWISLLLCLFTIFGHKFYEGKYVMGILYLLTGGLFGIGWLVDIFLLLFKPNPYYV